MRLVDDDRWGELTLIQEAEGESYRGKVMVAEVILRRTREKYFSDGTVAGTVLRDRQFSGWNHGANPVRIRVAKADTDDQPTQDCIRAWSEAKAGSNLVPNCRHYYNPRVCNPPWARDARVVAEEGNHRFVIPKE